MKILHKLSWFALVALLPLAANAQSINGTPNQSVTVPFGTGITGQPTDNANLASALAGKVDTSLTSTQAIQSLLNAPSLGTTGAGSGAWCPIGSTSGTACLTVAAIAGTPDQIALPTANGASGQVWGWLSDASGVQQTGWVTPTLAPGVTTSGIGAYWFPSPFGWAAPQNGAASTLTGTGNSNVVRYVVFTTPFTVKVSKASIFVTTVDASQTADFGIYNSAGTSKLWSIGAGTGISAGNANKQGATNTTATLAAGTYIFAWTESGTVAAVYAFNVNTDLYDLISATGTVPAYGTCGNAASTGVLPATCGTMTAATSAFTVPAVMLEP